MNTTSVQVVGARRASISVVKPKKTLTLSLAVRQPTTRSARPARRRRRSSTATCPTMHISGGRDDRAGQHRRSSSSRADQAPLHDTQVSLTFAGDAVPGTDYLPVNPVVTMRAGSKSASLTVQIVEHQRDPARSAHRRVAHPRADAVRGRFARHRRGHDPAARPATPRCPIVTLRSAATHLMKGEPYNVTLSLNKAVEPPVDDRARPTAATPRRAPTSRCPAATSSCRPARRRCRCDPDRRRQESSSRTGC